MPCWFATADTLLPFTDTDDTHAAEACRQWLKQAQGYVLHIMKNIEVVGSKAGGSQQQEVVAQEEEEEQDEGNGSSADAAWLVLCQDAYEVLSRVAQHLAGGISSVSPWAHVASACSS
jgi:hypothetical protein